MESRLPKVTIISLVFAIILGVIVAVGFYQAQIRGLIPFIPSNFPQLEIRETRTIVQEENAVISAVEKVSLSVVAIGAAGSALAQNSTTGTGFVVSEKGIIVTNKHIVSDLGIKYNVVTKDGKKFEIRKIYRDPVLDIAIIQIDGNDLKALELGDSSKLKAGQTAIAIGNELGKFTNTVTIGVISGLSGRVVAGDPFSGSAESLDDLIQTDAAINPGNSGGPLLNSAGQVIGVNMATTEGAQNIGFAVPINSIKKIADEFIQKGSVSRPFLGINYRFIFKDVAIMNEIPQGDYVQDVISESSADKAGIKIGDIITKVNGQAVDSETKIADIITGKKIGDNLNLTVWNNSKERSVTATLQELPNQ